MTKENIKYNHHWYKLCDGTYAMPIHGGALIRHSYASVAESATMVFVPNIKIIYENDQAKVVCL